MLRKFMSLFDTMTIKNSEVNKQIISGHDTAAAGDIQTQADIDLSSRSECSDTHVHCLDDTHVVRRHSASMAESGQDMDESTADVKRHGWVCYIR